MGSFCQSTPATVNQTQTYSPNPAIKEAGTTALNMAEGAASQPFQTPAAPVAPFNPFQTQAFDQIQGLQGGLDPYVANAGAAMTRASSPLTQGDISYYENPYADQALADMKKYVFDPQRRNTMGNAVQSAGGVGAERLALTSQNLDKTQGDALAQARAGFYANAAQIAQQQQQQAGNSAAGWLNLGLGAQSGNLQATGALAGAGSQQQQQQQRELMSPYEQTLARIAYPYQQSQFLAGITSGLSPAFGGTTTGYGTSTPAQPSLFNQLTGLTLGGIGAAGSLGWNPFGGSSGTGGPTWGGDGLSQSAMGGGYGGGVFADGGEVDDNEAMNVVPDVPFASGAAPNSGAHLDLRTPEPKQDKGGGGGDIGKMAQMAMMFLDTGGAVNPWDSGRGYDSGGHVELVDPGEFNSIDAQAPAEPNVFQPSVGTPGDVGTMPMPGAYTRPMPPMIPSPQPPPAQTAPSPGPNALRQIAPQPQAAPRAYNPDLKLQDFMMPKEEKPYPDALDRDWGQKAARSPWLSLVEAGAKIAQSTQPAGAALASGLQAGVGALTKQRSELRSEQQINQKAEELYRHAKSELNKYQRMTPRETEATSEARRYHDILADLGNRKVDTSDRRVDATNNRTSVTADVNREKIQARLKEGSLVYAGPVKGEEGMGYFYDRRHLDENGQPKIFKMKFDVGAKPTAGGRQSARQWAYETYTKLYPNDPQGASDILKGHKTMAAGDIRKAADNIARQAMAAQNIQPQDTEEWLAEHKRLSDLIYEKRLKELQTSSGQ